MEPTARPERQPGCRHARPPPSLSVEQPAGRIEQRSVGPEHPITLFYMALPAAAALAGITQYEAQQLLEALQEVHLVTEQEGRYQFHDLLAIYASERAQTDETAEARTEAIRQVLLWYLHSTDAAEHLLSRRSQRVTLDALNFPTPPLTFPTQDEALEWCETERLNLVAATAQAAEIGEYTIAWKLPNTLWGFLQLCKYWEDWIFTHEVALTAARELQDPQGEAWTLGSLAMACRDLRRFDEAIDYVERAISICRGIGWQWGEGIGLTILGAVYYDLRRLDDRSDDRFENAIVVLKQAQTILHAIGDKWGEGFALNNLGGIYRHLEEFDKAMDCLQQALDARRAVKDSNGEADTLNELGNVYGAIGEFDKALSYLQDALNVRQAIGNQQGEAYALQGIGVIQRQLGHLDDARESLQRALVIFEVFGNPQAAEVRSLLVDLKNL